MRIPASHPALPGHFPGSPVVPGVVILDIVLQQFSIRKGGAVTATGLPSVKFLQPLLPDQEFEIVFTDKSESRTVFAVVSGSEQIVSGTIQHVS